MSVFESGAILLYAAEKIPYAIDRYGREVRRLYGVLDGQLGRTGDCVAGAPAAPADARMGLAEAALTRSAS